MNANTSPVSCGLYIQVYTANDQLKLIQGPEVLLEAGVQHTFEWLIPNTGGQPVAAIGVNLASDREAEGCIYLDTLTWDGTPNVEFTRPADGGTMWRRAWVNATDHDNAHDWPEAFRLIQNEGTGLLIQGTREWTDYTVSSTIIPHLAEAAGIGARVQGMRRYYALLLDRDGMARLVKELDGTHLLAETPFSWELGLPYAFSLEVWGTRLRGWINESLLFEVQDANDPLLSGAVALICKEGRAATEAVCVKPRGVLTEPDPYWSHDHP